MSEPNVTSTSSVLLIGGPDAGKSNFLFRLWIAVDGGKGVLIKNGLPDEVEYLRTGAESLLKGEFAGRTSKEVLEHVSIPVKAAADPSRRGVLSVPDVPGERILEVYRLRQWAETWEKQIEPGCGCLMFVRAGSSETVMPLDYTACVAAFGAPLAEITPSKGQVGIPAAANLSANAPEPPTDVVLTDWIQFLRRAFTARVAGSHHPRIGLVVAAWDAVPTDFQERDPRDYLAENFPLVYQFVEANGDRFEFQVFGLSILSGDLKNDPDFLATFRQGTPANFGYVIHSLSGKTQKDADVTLPVAWALDWLSANSTSEDNA